MEEKKPSTPSCYPNANENAVKPDKNHDDVAKKRDQYGLVLGICLSWRDPFPSISSGNDVTVEIVEL